jgi:hypothetical protein
MSDLKNQLEQWIRTSQLIRLHIFNQKMERKQLIGRIIQYNELDKLILFYHDDQKQVYNVSLREIEDIELTQ